MVAQAPQSSPRDSLTLHQYWDPILPHYMRLREKWARVPTPFEHGGLLFDIMGCSSQGELLLRDQRAIHQDVRIESFAGRPVILDGKCWRVMSVEVLPGLKPVEAMVTATFQLVDARDHSNKMTVAEVSLPRLRFPSVNGEYKIGLVKHGIMRMRSLTSRVKTRLQLQPGQQFEARLVHHELEGPYAIEMKKDGKLIAKGMDHDGNLQHLTILLEDIAPRYKRVHSLDFGTTVDVDTFVYHEDQLRCRARNVVPEVEGNPIQDPLLASLPNGSMPRLTSGAEHLAVFEQFIRQHTSPNVAFSSIQRRLTMLNLSMSNQGDAYIVLDALIEFRRQNPAADICVVVSKLGPTEFQESPGFGKYLAVLAANRIKVNDFAGADGPTRQVMHGKAIVIDDKVLFSTGAVMDTRPINKADFSIELPNQAAEVFQRYTDEAIHADANSERRAELAAELASIGVVVNDPVAGLAYISRAQDALIRGARHSLLINMSELIDPAVTQAVIEQAASGVDVTIQVRELDLLSARLLASATTRYPNLRIEDSSWWEPRPHFNVIIADGCAAYVGSSYLWSTQRNMVHQGRSFENGVLLSGHAAAEVLTLCNELRTHSYRHNPMATAFSLSMSWERYHRLYLKDMFIYLVKLIEDILSNLQLVMTDLRNREPMYYTSKDRNSLAVSNDRLYLSAGLGLGRAVRSGSIE